MDDFVGAIKPFKKSSITLGNLKFSVNWKEIPSADAAAAGESLIMRLFQAKLHHPESVLRTSIQISEVIRWELRDPWFAHDSI